MSVFKQIYKYIVIFFGAAAIVLALYMTFEMDMVMSVGHGTSADGFGNEKNPENGKTYWNIRYLSERGLELIAFIGGINLIAYGYNIKSKEEKDGES